jgi:hypothetical protein
MWEMTLCTGPDDDLVTMTFETPEQWRDWLGLHHPALLRSWSGKGSSRTGYEWQQYGTDYYWSSIQRRVL